MWKHRRATERHLPYGITHNSANSAQHALSLIIIIIIWLVKRQYVLKRLQWRWRTELVAEVKCLTENVCLQPGFKHLLWFLFSVFIDELCVSWYWTEGLWWLFYLCCFIWKDWKRLDIHSESTNLADAFSWRVTIFPLCSPAHSTTNHLI